MSEKAKQIHATSCDYEVAKASNSPRIYSAKPKRKNGIKTHNMSKAMLAQTLASLFLVQIQGGNANDNYH